MLPIRRRLYQSQPGFSPRQLFSALQGAWLEPTPGTIWQENTGVTPTTTGGQTIGLMLDQSQGAALGPELVSNGTFDTDLTGWTVTLGSVSVIAGQATFATTGRITQALTCVAGQCYRVTVTVTAGGSGVLRFGTDATGATGGSINTGATLAVGTYTYYGFATASTMYVSIGTGGSASFDNVSLRLIAGNHAAQSVSGNRPTYQLDANSLPLARHDATDSLSVSLPNLGGGIYSASGSVYFATPQGMSALHNQAMGTSFTLPALSSDIYSWIVVPQRLSAALESRLERYMLRKAGLAIPDYLTDDSGSILTDDIGDPLLAG